jgi:hypothetical protein
VPVVEITLLLQLPLIVCRILLLLPLPIVVTIELVVVLVVVAAATASKVVEVVVEDDDGTGEDAIIVLSDVESCNGTVSEDDTTRAKVLEVAVIVAVDSGFSRNDDANVPILDFFGFFGDVTK